MIATLIPYFLACNISGDGGWPYGPEYVYNVQGNITRERPQEFPPTMFAFNMAMHCRPKNTMTLSCFFKDSTTYGEDHDFDMILDSRRFEINFNEMRAKSVTVPRDMNIAGRMYIRRFAPLLTVGFDLSGKTDQDGVFEVANSNEEKSKRNVTIWYPPETEDNRVDHPYELKILPAINKPTDKAIEITKEKYDYVGHRSVEDPFPSDSNKNRTPRPRIEDIKNRMKISKYSFESYGHETYKLNFVRTEFKYISDNYAAITLVDVVPADEPIPDVVNPITFSIFQ